MKAVVLVAGQSGRDFPPDSKPKCLYHAGGRVLLDIAVRSLLDAGVTDIRLVIGYRGEEIRKFVESRGWNIEFAWNPQWQSDAVASVEAGLHGVDDDVLLLCADLLIDADLIRGFCKTDPDRLAWVRSEIPWDSNETGYDALYRRDIDNSVIRIPRRMLGIFENCRERADRFLARYSWMTDISPGTGVYYGAALTETLNEFGPPEEVVIHNPIVDIDFYRQTDEHKVAAHLRRIGVSAPEART
jgi:CTP:molybdopterin cytidylyltransferase MocA